jgi:hypothetical protein
LARCGEHGQRAALVADRMVHIISAWKANKHDQKITSVRYTLTEIKQQIALLTQPNFYFLFLRGDNKPAIRLGRRQ